MSAAPQSATASRPRLLTGPFLALFAASLVYFIADGMTIPVLPVYVKGPLGAGDVALGLVFGAFSVTALLLRPLAGSFADRRGRRPILIGGAILLVVTMFGHVAAVSVELLVVARLLLGASEALFFVAAFTMASDLAPEERRGEALSLVSLSLYAGIAIGPFFGEAVLGEDRFVAVWIAAAVLAVVAIILAWRVPETLPAAASGAEPGSATAVCTTGGDAREPVASTEPAAVREPAARRYRFIHPRGIRPGLIVLAGTWGMAGFFVFAKPYGETLGLPQVAPLFLLYAGIVIAIRALMPWAPDRWGGRRLGAASLVVVMAGLALMGLFTSPVGLYVGTAVMALGVAFLPPAILTMAQVGIPADERGTLIGTASSFIEVSFGVAPIMLGVVASTLGYPETFLISSAIGGLGLILLAIRPARSAPAADLEAGTGPGVEAAA